jgi:hypothetical protein
MDEKKHCTLTSTCSVWIRFLSNRAPYAAELDALLSRDEVSGHEFVYGELLIGDEGVEAHLLASALVGHLKSWTADPRLALIARELGIGYD